ncbi:aminotransferase class I/II-fold pyridoxal phosphate-dependent enzyme [Glaciibacter flavus]|uniref:Aromatic amino acid aminotransferase n=1 Tax=Orlajensenia flava TaxID=2565934 RepID=A0A4S4FUC0_9MICO|nr:aminotransferase class I/II-fold pyridoxal phosphate-dependent enzyme [Glaciibacter flavus]
MPRPESVLPKLGRVTDPSALRPGVKLRPEIAALPPYRQGRAAAPDGYKLSSNENPFDPLPGVASAVTAASDFNRYPDATALVLRGKLAERLGVSVDEVHVGAGSVSIIAQLVLAAAGPGDEVVYSWRSFEAYPGLVTVAGARSVQVPNRADHGHDLPAMAAAVTEATRLVIVCTPNNPTGAIVTADEFSAFMGAVPSDVLVILDEAYVEFVGDPRAVNGIPLLGHYPNLVVLRTFSKAYGLAGLRIGYAVGPVAVLDAARATAIPLSVTGQATAAAIASLDAEDELLDRVRTIAARRDDVWRGLNEQGWAVPKPQGNFVWLPTGEHTTAAADELFASGLVVRAFPPDGIRISIGEHESVEKLLSITGKIVQNLPEGHSARRIA